MSPRLKEKSGVYFLFSRIFREAPDQSILTEIVERKLLTLSYHFFNDDWQQTEAVLENPRWLSEAEKIAIEYTGLFLVSGERAIYPYGSFYCDSIVMDTSTASSSYFPPESRRDWGVKGLIGGPSATEVNKFYLKAGYQPNSKGHTLPDHLACELEFLGRMYADGNVQGAETFLKNFIGPWAFVFLEKFKNQNYSDFYERVAASLEKFLEGECRGVL